MSLWELFVIAVGLSMDAFAVSICKGLSVGKCKVKHMLICGLYFGAFQAIMPSIGYLLGAQFETLVSHPLRPTLRLHPAHTHRFQHDSRIVQQRRGRRSHCGFFLACHATAGCRHKH